MFEEMFLLYASVENDINWKQLPYTNFLLLKKILRVLFSHCAALTGKVQTDISQRFDTFPC